MSLRRLVFLCVLLYAGDAFAHGGTVIIQVRSDLEPVVDFSSIRMTFNGSSGPPFFFEHTADPSRDYAAGVRVLEESGLPADNYLIDIEMLQGGTVIVNRPVRYVIEDHFHWPWGEHAGDFEGSGLRVITVLLTLSGPYVDSLVVPYKSAALKDDNDGSGTVSPGDVLQYTVEFEAPHDILRGSHFTDEPGPSATLIPGTVTTTNGVVFRGNFPVDSDILVNFDPISEGETVRITYEATVAPVARNQGEVVVVGNGLSYPAPTDDPSTQEPEDPTDVPILCGEGQGGPTCCGELDDCAEGLDTCEGERDQCRAGLANCEGALDACTETKDALAAKVSDLEGALAALLADDDGDGVPAVRDDCPDTSAGASVDVVGCSAAQFCGGIVVTSPRAWRRCRLADWQNDEPVGAPRDCRPAWWFGACVPR